MFESRNLYAKKKILEAIWQNIEILKMVITGWWVYSQLYFLNVLKRVWILLGYNKTVNVILKGERKKLTPIILVNMTEYFNAAHNKMVLFSETTPAWQNSFRIYHNSWCNWSPGRHEEIGRNQKISESFRLTAPLTLEPPVPFTH